MNIHQTDKFFEEIYESKSVNNKQELSVFYPDFDKQVEIFPNKLNIELRIIELNTFTKFEGYLEQVDNEGVICIYVLFT